MWGSIVMKKLMQGPESATDKEKAWGKLLRLDCRFIQVGRTQSPQKASLELHSHTLAISNKTSSRRKVHRLQWITGLCKSLPIPVINEDNSAMA